MFDDTKIWRFMAVALVCIVVMVSAGIGVIGTVNVSSNNTNTCEQVNVLRVAVTTVLHQSEATLPSNPFFKHRPDLLHAAEKQVEYDLSLFQPIPC
ncbi:MAG: hypothetical protein ACXVHB_05870 [Solirubrobacteraceae bacterium]